MLHLDVFFPIKRILPFTPYLSTVRHAEKIPFRDFFLHSWTRMKPHLFVMHRVRMFVWFWNEMKNWSLSIFQVFFYTADQTLTYQAQCLAKRVVYLVAWRNLPDRWVAMNKIAWLPITIHYLSRHGCIGSC